MTSTAAGLSLEGSRLPAGAALYWRAAPMTESELVRGCRAGRPEALRALAEGYYDRVFRVAMTLTRHRHSAEDLTQETFGAAVRAIKGFRAQSSLFTWLVGILRRQWLYRRRKDGRLRILGEVDPGAADDGNVERDEARRALREAIHSMQEDDRVILELFYIEEIRYVEIASILEIPLGTVKSRLNAARAKLKVAIGGRHAV